MNACHMCVCLCETKVLKVLNPLELERQVLCEPTDVGAGNRTLDSLAE